jgi:hypothetical protein
MCCFCSHCNAFYFMQFHVVRGLRFSLPFWNLNLKDKCPRRLVLYTMKLFIYH